MKLRELRDKHRSLSVQMRKFHDQLESEDRGMTAEERSQWDGWVSDRKDLDDRITRAEQVSDFDEDAETREASDRQRWEESRASYNEDPNRPLTAADELRGFSAWGLGVHCQDRQARDIARRMGISPAQSSITLNLDRGCGVDGVSFDVPKTAEEVRRQHCQRQEVRHRDAGRRCAPETRAQSVGTNSAGGYAVPNEMMRPLEEALLQWGGMRNVSTVISTATGATLPIPTVNDTANKGEIIAENSAINALDTTFSQVTLGAYKYSTKYILVSVELLQDSSVNLPQFLGRALGTRIGRITNDHFTTGTGTGQPQGVVTGAANSGITAAGAGAITYTELLNVFHSIDPAYRANSNWMCNDATLLVLHKLVDTTGRPILIPSINSGEADTILGRSLIVNQSMAGGATSKGLIFGDFSNYYIREVKQLELMRLDELYAASHQVAFLGYARYDGKLINAGTNPVKYMTLT